MVKFFIAVTLSQSYGATVLKPNEPTVTTGVGGLGISFQSLWQCSEKEGYLRGLEDGRKQFAREMQDNVLAEEFWDDSKETLNNFKLFQNSIQRKVDYLQDVLEKQKVQMDVDNIDMYYNDWDDDIDMYYNDDYPDSEIYLK